MARVGVENVGDDDLLAILLRSGVQGRNASELARELLQEYGSLTGLAGASAEDIVQRVHGMGPVKAQILLASLEMGRRLIEEGLPARPKIRAPEDAAGLMRERVRGMDAEVFWVLRLDTKNCLKGEPVQVTKGLLDASLVHPREVFREAIRSATAAVVMVHNHPSGDPTPSAEDVRITRQLIDAGRVVDIRVLDHVIVGRPSGNANKYYLSMRETGAAEFG